MPKDPLASIGRGNVPRHIVDSGTIPVCRLTEVSGAIEKTCGVPMIRF